MVGVSDCSHRPAGGAICPGDGNPLLPATPQDCQESQRAQEEQHHTAAAQATTAATTRQQEAATATATTRQQEAATAATALPTCTSVAVPGPVALSTATATSATAATDGAARATLGSQRNAHGFHGYGCLLPPELSGIHTHPFVTSQQK